MVRCRELVIGSGPGGAVTAGLLAEAGHDVILVEEGPASDPDAAGAPEPFSLEEMARMYRYRGLNPTFGKPKIAFAEGRCLGGGSEINSAIYHRTPPEILERWQRSHGLEGASADEMAPHFEAVERSIEVCRSPGPLPAASQKLRLGAEGLGWNWLEAQRWVRYTGAAHPDGSPASMRMSMGRTWIPRAKRAGVRLMAATRIHRLERRGHGWIARAGGGESIHADHIFLCCGAVQTPLLLRRSGLRHNTGNTLAMHPTSKVVAVFDDEVNYPGLGVPFVQVKQFAPRITFGSSIASLPHLALAMLDHPAHATCVLSGWKSAAIYYAALTGAPSGTIRRWPLTGDPLVRYQPTAEDRRDLAEGMRNLCRLLLAAGARELYSSLAGDVPLRSPDDLTRLPAEVPATRTNLMTIHLFCSCPMGGRRENSAVDSWGRVWGAPGLSIHDASILCDAPSVNPQGTIMAFARRNTMRYFAG